MRKILSMLIILGVLGTLTQAEAGQMISNNDETVPSFAIKICVHIVFGRKKFDCRRFGICEVNIYFDGPSDGGTSFREAIATAYFDEEGNFTCEFKKEDLSSETQSNFFDANFRMEEDFDIPQEVLRELKRDTPYKITVGDYVVEDTGKSLIVRF